MRRAAVLFSLAALAGCPASAPPGTNPPRVWLALNGSELMVRLQAIEPAPF
jgi:hypothetical protein